MMSDNEAAENFVNWIKKEGMSKFWFGLLAGIMLGAAVMFLMGRKMEEQSYARGYDKGTTEGMTKGIVQGVIQEKADEQHHADSVATANKKAMAAKPKKVNKPKPKPVDVYNKNYDRLGEEIKETPAP